MSCHGTQGHNVRPPFFFSHIYLKEFEHDTHSGRCGCGAENACWKFRMRACSWMRARVDVRYYALIFCNFFKKKILRKVYLLVWFHHATTADAYMQDQYARSSITLLSFNNMRNPVASRDPQCCCCFIVFVKSKKDIRRKETQQKIFVTHLSSQTDMRARTHTYTA